MADKWDKYAEAIAPATDKWSAFEESAPAKSTERVGGQKVLDYTNETLSNIPGSTLKFAKNIGTAILNPIDTAGGLAKVATGTLQNMTPGYVTPERPGFSAEANAAGHALKERYGSPAAIAETIKTDPVGAASDASLALGGVSGIARGASAAANVARLPRVASAASGVSRGAALASDIANPLTVPLKAAGELSKVTAQPFIKSALGLPGKAERHGANPAKAALEETKGIRPATVQASAIKRLGELDKELKSLAQQATAAGNTADLAPAIKVIEDEISSVRRANGLTSDLEPMLSQLTEARSGFGGTTYYPPGSATPAIAAKQPPLDFLAMKKQFGDDYTKFDANVPLKNTTRQLGNRAYHELSTEFNRAVPGAQPVNQLKQSLIPVKEGAQRANEKVGAVQRGVDRATRPTGAMAPTIAGAAFGGPLGALGVMTVQEALASPTVRMALARTLFGSGKTAAKPVSRRIGNVLGVAGSTLQEPPHFAKGGIAGRHGSEKIIVGDGGEPEAIIPLSHIRSSIGPKAQQRLLKGIGSHLGIGKQRKSTLGEEIAHARRN